MGFIKTKLFDFANLVSDYRWHMGTMKGLDNFMKEQTLEHYEFYLNNKEAILEMADEIENNENKINEQYN